jgi:hypothetical protein
MFGPALNQLLSDLREATGRSLYEETLVRELSALETVFGGAKTFISLDLVSSRVVAGSRFRIGIEQGQGETFEKDFEATSSGDRIFIESLDVTEPAAPADLVLHRADIKRIQCTEPKCPNKRL